MNNSIFLPSVKPVAGGSGAVNRALTGTHQYISSGVHGQTEVLRGSLLQLCVGGAQVVVRVQHVLDLRLDLGEEVDVLDVGGEQQSAGWRRAQVVLEQTTDGRGSVRSLQVSHTSGRGSGCGYIWLWVDVGGCSWSAQVGTVNTNDVAWIPMAYGYYQSRVIMMYSSGHGVLVKDTYMGYLVHNAHTGTGTALVRPISVI